MPIGAITMILANVGLQVYNNWCSNRQNQKLSGLREEFRQAAEKRRFDRMLQLMREGQKLTLELEEEQHKNRLDDQNKNVDNLLKQLTHKTAINKWPLKVLPIIMQNRSLGNLITHVEENVALHCIFTPSNNYKFNKNVFPLIENALEQHANKYWSTMGDHPVLFYGGAWKTTNGILAEAPTSVQVDLMRQNLKNIPTLLISPYFDPTKKNLLFQVRMWGVGAVSSDEFSIPEIVPKESDFRFQYDYSSDTNYEDEEIRDWTVGDLVPYLQCMIGYLADTYFWSAYGLAPLLPNLLTNGTIDTDGMKYLIDDSREYYGNLLLESEKKLISQPFTNNTLLNLYEGSATLWDDEERKEKLGEIFLADYQRTTGMFFDSLESIWEHVKHSERNGTNSAPIVPLLQSWYSHRNGSISLVKESVIDSILRELTFVNNKQYEIIDIDNCEIETIKRFAEFRKQQAVNAAFFIFIIWNKKTIIGSFFTEENQPCVYHTNNTARYFIIRYMGGSIESNWDNIYYNYNLVSSKLSKMKEKTFEKQFEQSFARIGRGLGQIIDGLSPNERTEQDPIWGKDVPTEKKDVNEQLLAYFISNAKKKVIPSIGVENMTVQEVLDWVDKNVTPFADKVYIIKGQDKETNKFVFCSFFGSGDNVMIKPEDPCVCFVTSSFNDEMQQTFNDNNICVIPLK